VIDARSTELGTFEENNRFSRIGEVGCKRDAALSASDDDRIAAMWLSHGTS
jgi:hypothetical protein